MQHGEGGAPIGAFPNFIVKTDVGNVPAAGVPGHFAVGVIGITFIGEKSDREGPYPIAEAAEQAVSTDVGEIGFSVFARVDVACWGFGAAHAIEFAFGVALVPGHVAVVVASADEHIFIPATVETPQIRT